MKVNGTPVITLASPRPVDVEIDSPAAVSIELGTPGKPGAPGPPGPDVGTPIHVVEFDDVWPPVNPAPGLWLRLAP
jgi:hypothetical protein